MMYMKHAFMKQCDSSSSVLGPFETHFSTLLTVCGFMFPELNESSLRILIKPQLLSGTI